jgi:multimeric flavodoxin WrbA
MIEIRKGQASTMLARDDFHRRYVERFVDPAFDAERESIARLEEIAWQAYREGRKAPVTRAAGPGHADPSYEASVEWLATSERLKRAQSEWAKPATRSRVLIVCGSARNDGSCPGEVSKTWRLSEIARNAVVVAGVEMGFAVDILDLSRLTSEFGKYIHPCKSCVSTAMPLCHWPCSCYPNHALGQVNDWMAEIYERWVAAHGVIIAAPTYWYQSPSVLKLMIDRLVCADGGNPDVTSTHGKTVAEAKQLEADGWSYPKHLAGRTFGLIVHGDVAGVESQRRNLADWLQWMGLVDAGALAQLDRYIGYYEPYWNSHVALDRDHAVQAEVRNVAEAVVRAVALVRRDALGRPDAGAVAPRPK